MKRWLLHKWVTSSSGSLFSLPVALFHRHCFLWKILFSFPPVHLLFFAPPHGLIFVFHLPSVSRVPGVSHSTSPVALFIFYSNSFLLQFQVQQNNSRWDDRHEIKTRQDMGQREQNVHTSQATGDHEITREKEGSRHQPQRHSWTSVDEKQKDAGHPISLTLSQLTASKVIH